MKIVVFNKPFDVLSQFREEGTHSTLAQFIDDPMVRVAGRLDRDSEGLLLLTDSGAVNQFITNPKHKQYKTYLAQVEGEVFDDAIAQLCAGVELNDGPTLPAKVRRIEQPDWLWERVPPIRFRANIPTTWLEIQICEGRNRQVRRMTAAVGFPTLRLVRSKIGSIDLTRLDLAIGELCEIEPLLYPEFKNLPDEKPRTERRSGSGFRPKFQAHATKEQSQDKPKTKQQKTRERVKEELARSDGPKPRRITNGTTRPNSKSRGRGR